MRGAMASTGQTETVYTNNRWILRFVIRDEDDPAPVKPPLDITGHTIRFALARLGASGAPLVNNPVLDFNSGDEPLVVVITDAPNGAVEVRLDDSITVAVPPREYYLELEDVDGLGNPVVVATGNLTVLPNVVNA